MSKEHKRIGTRRMKTVILNDKPVNIQEITVKQMLQLFPKQMGDMVGIIPDEKEENSKGFFDQAKELLSLSMGLSFEELSKLAPSQIKELYQEFKEVNAVFFEIARTMNPGAQVSKLKAWAINHEAVQAPVNLLIADWCGLCASLNEKVTTALKKDIDHMDMDSQLTATQQSKKENKKSMKHGSKLSKPELIKA